MLRSLRTLAGVSRWALSRVVPLLFATSIVAAQDTASTANVPPTPAAGLARITLRDGSLLYGRVLEVTASTIRVSSSIGETLILRDNIREVKSISATSLHDGEVWPDDPSRTRLFFAPTGRMLRREENYFADAYVFFPSLQYGATDRMSVGAGMSVFPFVSVDEQLYYVTPKVSVYASPTVNVAVGVLAAGAKWLSDQTPLGIGYGVATFGGEDGSITTGAGFGFSRTTTSSAAVLMLGGSQRVSRNVALVSENYYATTGHGGSLFSAGMRFMSERLAVDLAAAGASGGAAPYVAFIYRW